MSSLAIAACLTPTDPILAAAVVGGRDVEGVDEGDRVVAPSVRGDVAAAAEEDGRDVVVGGSKGEHGDGARSGIDSNDAVWHVWEVFLGIIGGIPEDCRQVKIAFINNNKNKTQRSRDALVE